MADPAASLQHPLLKPRPLLAARMLCQREIVRFFRQRNRVIGAVGQPIVFWLLFGAGLHRTFRLEAAESGGASFLEYFFPGTLMLILLFTAIFATISIIEDRREGFLQNVLVAPLPRWSMLLGKVMGGSLIALAQGLIFLVLALTLQVSWTVVTVAALIFLLFISAFALTSLGFLLAWRMESTQGFHAIMNLLLMPMWLLSGAFFPAPQLVGGDHWSQVLLHWVIRLNPLSYCVAGVRQLMFPLQTAHAGWMPSLASCWLVAAGFALLAFAAAWYVSRSQTSGDLL